MSPKRSASEASGAKAKRPRKSVSLEVKLDVIKRRNNGQSVGDISKFLLLPKSTVCTILKKQEDIKTIAENVSDAAACRITRARDVVMEEMERLLHLWIQDMNRRNARLSYELVKEKALSLFEMCKTKHGGEDYKGSFLASHGWYSRFKSRADIKRASTAGEVASADKEAAAAFSPILKEKIESGEYCPRRVLNMDETGLYWKKMSNKTFISREEKTAPGFKAAKDRITLALTGNAEGDLKLKPLAIYHSENPRAFKGFVKEQLDVVWRANKKGWMTSQVNHSYMVSYVGPALERYARRHGLPNRFLLLVDNAPSHPNVMNDWCDNIEVMFLPPNTTSIIQPLDQGIIATFKALYLRKCMRKLVHYLDTRPTATVKDFWKAFNIKDGVDYIVEAWEEVPSSCMNGCWRKVWPEVINDFTGFPIEKVHNEIVSLSHEAGLEEVDQEDIIELLDSHAEPLTNEELEELENRRAFQEEKEEEKEEEEEEEHKVMNISALRRILGSFEDAINLMKEMDPNSSRSNSIASNVHSSLKIYNQLLEEKKRRAKQTKISSFFSPSQTPTPEDISETPKPSCSGIARFFTPVVAPSASPSPPDSPSAFPVASTSTAISEEEEEF